MTEQANNDNDDALRVCRLRSISAVTYIAWSPCSRYMAIDCANKVCVLRADDAAEGSGKPENYQAVREFIVPDAPSLCITSVRWSPCGAYIAVASIDNRLQYNPVRVWRVDMCGTTNQQWDLRGAPDTSTCNVVWSPCGTYIAAGCLNGVVCIWRFDKSNTATDNVAQHELRGHTTYVDSMTWSPCSDYLATSSARVVRIWRFDKSKTTSELVHELQEHVSAGCVAWSPCGAYIVSTSQDNTVCVFLASTGKQVNTLGVRNPGFAMGAAWLPCSKYVVTASGLSFYNYEDTYYNNEITMRVWCASTGKQVRKTRSMHAFCIAGWSPCLTRVVARRGGAAFMWTVGKWTTHTHQKFFTSAARHLVRRVLCARDRLAALGVANAAAASNNVPLEIWLLVLETLFEI